MTRLMRRLQEWRWQRRFMRGGGVHWHLIRYGGLQLRVEWHQHCDPTYGPKP